MSKKLFKPRQLLSVGFSYQKEKQVLLVPMQEKDIVKKLGANWNYKINKWEVDKNYDLSLFKRWLPSEMKYPFLYIDLVPSSTWFENMRSILKKQEWDDIRKYIYKRADYKCEICGNKGEKHPVEAHERWFFDEKQGIQRLVGIQSLCPNCHEATHFGLANVRGRSSEAKEHILKVNNWGDNDFLSHYNKAFDEWERKSQKNWILDLKYVINVFEDMISIDTKQKIITYANNEINDDFVLNNNDVSVNPKDEVITIEEYPKYIFKNIEIDKKREDHKSNFPKNKIDWRSWKTWYLIYGTILFLSYMIMYS